MKGTSPPPSVIPMIAFIIAIFGLFTIGLYIGYQRDFAKQSNCTPKGICWEKIVLDGKCMYVFSNSKTFRIVECG